MKTTVRFHSHLASGGEILAESANFLPVEPAWSERGDEIFLPALQHLAGFMPVLKFRRKNLTVAQPLLNGGLR